MPVTRTFNREDLAKISGAAVRGEPLQTNKASVRQLTEASVLF
jgi:hypothetical protein